RVYWTPSPWGVPDRRSLVFDPQGGITQPVARKRKEDRPYVVGQWCAHTRGAWALPFEGADLVLGARLASEGDWDALVRRGVFLRPEVWGSAATGTSGGQDVFPLPEVLNANPQIFALLPHAASIYLRGEPPAKARTRRGKGLDPATWDPRRGRL